MNLILLNSIKKPSTFIKEKFEKNIDSDKIKTRLESMKQRNSDNLKQSVSFIKQIGKKDIHYINQLHTDMVQEINKNNVKDFDEDIDEENTSTMVSDTDMSSLNPLSSNDDIFDN